MRKSFFKDRATGLADRTETAVSAIAEEVRAQVADLTQYAASTAEDAYGQAKKQVRGAATMVANSVEDRPLAVLLAVGLLSALMGFLLARR